MRAPQGIKRTDPRPEEKTLGAAVPEITGYVDALKQNGRKHITLALRQLLRMAREYPRQPFLSAVTEAAHYGLYDLNRLERMILRRVASEYFQLNSSKEYSSTLEVSPSQDLAFATFLVAMSKPSALRVRVFHGNESARTPGDIQLQCIFYKPELI